MTLVFSFVGHGVGPAEYGAKKVPIFDKKLVLHAFCPFVFLLNPSSGERCRRSFRYAWSQAGLCLSKATAKQAMREIYDESILDSYIGKPCADLNEFLIG